MATATAPVNTLQRELRKIPLQLSTVQIYRGAAAAVVSGVGYGTPLVPSNNTHRFVGVWGETYNNTAGTVGGYTTEIIADGIFVFSQTGTTITIANIDQPAYFSDDNTVTLTPGTTYAGVIRFVDASGNVWVDIRPAVWSPVQVVGNFIYETSADNLTASASATQSGATVITTQTSRFATVAATGHSVVLPASAPGLELLVMNHGANPMQVFGNGTDTIDDVAYGTGVTQMQNSLVIYTCASAGKWYTEGLHTGFGTLGLPTISTQSGITAHAGGGQGSATAIAYGLNRITTVATQGESVVLPASAVGMQVTINNRGANPCQVYGAGTDTINGIAYGTGISHGINVIATYACSVAGNWEVQFAQSQQPAMQALSASGAVPPHVPHDYVVTKAGVAALTLAAPTATTDDGVTITITSNSAYAHTLTATSLLQTGTASVNVATFAAYAGAGLTLIAYQGKWNVISSVGITFS